MYVFLPHNFKGTHMSRFVQILNSHEREISVESFKDMLSEMVERLESERGHIEMAFPFFVNKRRRRSQAFRACSDYAVTLIGEIRNGKPDVYQGGRTDHQPVPVFEIDLGPRRTQPTLTSR